MDQYIKKIKLYFNGLIKKDHPYKQEGIRPSRDWKIIVISLAIILFATALMALYFYIQVNNGSLFKTPEDSSNVSVTIDQKALEKTIEKIDVKQATLDELLRNKTTLPDPSR